MLKLVNDISSIKATLQSNHTLREIDVGDDTHRDMYESVIKPHIDTALGINRRNNPEAAGRKKVTQTQLNSAKRAELMELQEVNQSIFNEIDPLLLPEVFALVGRHHGQGELYFALKSSIAGVISTVNRKECIRQQRDYHLAKAKQLDAELAAIEAAEESTVSVGSETRSSKKRRAC